MLRNLERKWEKVKLGNFITKYDISNDGCVMDRELGEMFIGKVKLPIYHKGTTCFIDIRKFIIDNFDRDIHRIQKRAVIKNYTGDKVYVAVSGGAVYDLRANKRLPEKEVNNIMVVDIEGKEYSVAEIIYNTYIGKNYGIVKNRDGNIRHNNVHNLYYEMDLISYEVLIKNIGKF